MRFLWEWERKKSFSREWEWEWSIGNGNGKILYMQIPIILYKLSIRHLRQVNESSLSPAAHWRSGTVNSLLFLLFRLKCESNFLKIGMGMKWWEEGMGVWIPILLTSKIQVFWIVSTFQIIVLNFTTSFLSYSSTGDQNFIKIHADHSNTETPVYKLT